VVVKCNINELQGSTTVNCYCVSNPNFSERWATMRNSAQLCQTTQMYVTAKYKN